MSDASLTLSVDATSRAAPYEQIREQITSRVAAGDLPVGTRLPPVRSLAEQLGVAPGTVARAYKELEAAGVVETRGRAGTVVAGGIEGVERELQLAASVFADRVRSIGASSEQALRAVGVALGR